MEPKKILVADNSKEGLDSLANLLRTSGFRVVTATDGLSAQKKYESERPDLAILEAFLPKLTGFDLCKKIIDEFDRKIPIILVTEFLHGKKCKEETFELYGASAFFEKPVNKEELLSTISSLLEEDKEKKEKESEPSSLHKADSEEKVEHEISFLDNKFSVEVKRDDLEDSNLNLQTELEESRFDEEKESVPRFGEYILLEKISSGGMGEVYKSKRRGPEGFEKVVAIKRIHSHLTEENKEFINMFVDEAKLAAQLSHPNIVQTYDFGKFKKYYFIVMEYVLGKDLNTILARIKNQNKRMPCRYSTFIGIGICQALNYAHQKRDVHGKLLDIVHRDVSPKNILISFEGEVKLADFGVAKAASKIHQTIPGSIKGKVPYMSPQQARGEGVDQRSDIFSLGTVLFEMVTGEKLFSEESDIALLQKVQKGDIIPPSEKDDNVPRELENIILKALQHDLEKRYQNALDFKEDLETFVKKYQNVPTHYDLSQFMASLFADEIEGKLAAQTATSVSSSQAKTRDLPRKVMLADDSTVIQRIVNRALSKANLEIYSTSNGREVLNSIEKINPDIILLDINLPKKNGYDICEFIMNNRKLSETRVILLKEPFEKIDYKKLDRLSYEEIIQKPLDSKKLVLKVKEILEKKE